MGIASTGRRFATGTLRALAAVLVAGTVIAVAPASPTVAQSLGGPAETNGQMLLEADTLTYDNDAGVVTAAGNVRIDYNGIRLVAQRVSFYRESKRLVAYGNVQMVDREGNKSFAEEIDVTDNLRTGFVNALRIETTDKTYFASESAEQQSEDVTRFNNGVYTACEPCEDNPEKPPLWRIRSSTIIWNKKKKTIYFVRPTMELFGLPIAFFPAFEIPDHTVKRKSGFLFPTPKWSSTLGFGASIPYYWALSPSYDLTTTLHGYTKQGFLGEAEWRQRFNNGEYSVKVAGIYQLQPSQFTAGTVDAAQRMRAMIGTRGHFQINPRWAFGWDILVQSDKNFAATYGIAGFNDSVKRDQIYLTGLNGRNNFDLRVMRFQVQESAPAGSNEAQPWVLPILDYSYTPDMAVAGGEINIDINVQSVRRSALSTSPTAPVRPGIIDTNIPGVQGSATRLTAEAEWKRNIVTPGGLVVTPILHARGDAIFQNLSAAATTAIAGLTADGAAVATDIRSTYLRYMATAGLEVRWPFAITSENSSHVIEPIGQIFARPNEPFVASAGIANEDAQSMVFDATTLFERDKFSGYDRIEGGVRANVGLRYSGIFANGWTANAVVGQSFHLAGVNSFGAPDLVNAGAYSGLETSRSDYVGMLGIAAPNGSAASVGARVDETTLDLRRIDVKAAGSVGDVSVGGTYSFIQAQPLYGFAANRHQLTASASARVHEFWQVFGSATYDFVANKLLTNSIGFAYDDECFRFVLSANQSRSSTTSRVDTSFALQLSFRTLGDVSPGAFSLR
ncbi:LPS-assembly protein LptD [Mesorhizobium sp. Z1-4]|uniref:LPS-assembly protein LptD n=1 Tax=Mesorhizobium sp. Z1-4 TaxID=2448478 RepID=UPI001FE01DE5|nr:LPS-assembly protein LptD [Mesorhizobium sp. Z1-4]